MNTPHQNPDSSWFQPEPPAGYQAPEQRQRDPWKEPDPLTGPLPPGDNEIRASIAEVQDGVYASGGSPMLPPPAPPTSGSEGYGAAGTDRTTDEYPDGMQRQFAERVPRYTGAVPPTGSPAYPRSDGGDAALGAQATASHEAVPAEARFEPHTNVLPTMQPGQGQSGQPPEPGIPPSLSPMLGEGSAGLPAAGFGQQYTEPISRPPSAGAPPMPRPGSTPSAGFSSAVTISVVLVTLLAVVPSLLLVYDAVSGGDRVSASGAIGGTLMLVGLPVLAAGVRSLLTGPSGDGHPGGPWAVLRPPAAYLLVGVGLLLAAGLAAA